MNEFSAFAKRLKDAAAGLEKKAERVVDEVGQGALKDARTYAPTDTGDLARGLRYDRQGTTATVTTSTFYAPFQEFGTSQMAPNPFVGPSAREWGPKLVLEVERLRDRLVKDL